MKVPLRRGQDAIVRQALVPDRYAVNEQPAGGLHLGQSGTRRCPKPKGLGEIVLHVRGGRGDWSSIRIGGGPLVWLGEDSLVRIGGQRVLITTSANVRMGGGYPIRISGGVPARLGEDSLVRIGGVREVSQGGQPSGETGQERRQLDQLGGQAWQQAIAQGPGQIRHQGLRELTSIGRGLRGGTPPEGSGDEGRRPGAA